MLWGVDPFKAKGALALAQGVANGATEVDPLLVEGFNSVGDAARAHAYLAGFVLQLLADVRHEPVSDTVGYVRSKLDYLDGLGYINTE